MDEEPISPFVVLAGTIVVAGCLYVLWRRCAPRSSSCPELPREPSVPRKPKIPFTLDIAAQFFDHPSGATLNPFLYAGNLGTFSIFSEADNAEQDKLEHLLYHDRLDCDMDKAMGTLLGNVIGDALGAPFEFSPVRYDVLEMTNGFSDKHLWKTQGYNKFELRPGQWTDDASMALCLCDSLLVKAGFNPYDLRLRFQNWWRVAYCNAFGYDKKRKSKTSCGLGGNINMSMAEFSDAKGQSDYTRQGNKNTSGNGSVMRNAAIPIFYHGDITQAQKIAALQSRTTHQGDEAAECCRLLTFICVRAINSPGRDAVHLLDDLSEFATESYSVGCLATSKREQNVQELPDWKAEERNWDWKDPHFRYAPKRAKQDPGYMGSYCMDAMVMALHCVYTTTSFKDALLKSVNVRGDSDSVTAVTGQLAGAIYGASSIPKDWITKIEKWDPNGDIPLRAWRLFYFQHQPVQKPGSFGVRRSQIIKVTIE